MTIRNRIERLEQKIQRAAALNNGRLAYIAIDGDGVIIDGHDPATVAPLLGKRYSDVRGSGPLSETVKLYIGFRPSEI